MSLKQRLGLAAEPVFLMDGSAFIYRGFFANRNMQRSDGFPTNSLVVVSRVLLRILREERPRYFAFVQDGKGPNFRHEIFPLYKANRDATPEDLVRQLDPIHRMVRALGLRLGGPAWYGPLYRDHPWLGDGTPLATARHIRQAVRLMWGSLLVFATLASLLLAAVACI